MFEFREELLHPMLSHFPIALLLLLAIVKPAELIMELKKVPIEKLECVRFLSLFLLYTSAVFSIITLFLGDNAFDIVKNDLCSLTPAYNHEDLAHMTLYFIVGCLLVQVLLQMKILKGLESIAKIGLILLIFTANFYLIQTAHTGGKLVYEQGAGVRNITRDCQK